MNTINTIIVYLLFLNCNLFANNIEISNLNIVNTDIINKQVQIQFDISWENSWHDTENWDAVWLFIKYRTAGSNDAWQHATLNSSGQVSPIGSIIDVSNDQKGGFLHRNINGNGTANFTNVQLRWNYGGDGVISVSNIDIKVFGIEMVYVPQGSFYLGDGQTANDQLYANFELGTTGNVFQVTSENAITLGGGTATSLGNNNDINHLQVGDDFNDSNTQNLPAAFPKGFNAFYCMKYEMTQQQFVDMLNCSTPAQQILLSEQSHFILFDGQTLAESRYGISETAGIYTTTEPFVPMIFMDWIRAAAYADWSALRPMTELEFTKACRGPVFPVVNEFAWGTANIDLSDTFTLNNISLTNEGIIAGYDSSGSNGNCWVNAGSQNLLVLSRVGVFAANSLNTGRISSGSSYYGIMELSGHAWERTISVGHSQARNYTGTHGDGNLSVQGYANELNWTGNNGSIVNSNTGVGYRGGALRFPTPNLERNARVSNRVVASGFYNNVIKDDGARFIRTVD